MVFVTCCFTLVQTSKELSLSTRVKISKWSLMTKLNLHPMIWCYPLVSTHFHVFFLKLINDDIKLLSKHFHVALGCIGLNALRLNFLRQIELRHRMNIMFIFYSYVLHQDYANRILNVRNQTKIVHIRFSWTM